MKTTIFYFSGTGNSLYIAKQLAHKLENVQLVNIAQIISEKTINIQADKIGFVFPLYFYGIPRIIENFIGKIGKHNIDYCFTVITAMYPDGLGLEQMGHRLQKKNIDLNSSFYIQMPNNFILTRKADSERTVKMRIKKAAAKVEKIVKIIRENKNISPKESRLFNKLLNSRESYAKWHQEVHDLDTNFVVSDTCNQCGLCVKKCPVKNISLTGKVPLWKHNCEQCLRCLHFCPREAIEYGAETVGKRRYKGIHNK